MSKPLIVLAAGGTGGHVFPAEALASELSSRGYRLALVTDKRGHEYGGQLGAIDTYPVKAGGVAGRGLFGRIKSAIKLALGVFQAKRLLAKLNPAVVVGFGGYASIPAMSAAVMSHLPTALHEQNAVLGRANRLLAAKVVRICTSFEETEAIPAEASGHALRTGMPVRPAVLEFEKAPYPELSDDGEINILVLGGSQGAKVFSDVLPDALANVTPELKARLKITQQCRPEFLDETKAAYASRGLDAELATFFDDVPQRLAKSHLLITRAGASTVAELTTVGRPAILVPYPHAIDDHQTRNAHAVDEAGAGWLIPQDAFTPESLARRLEELVGGQKILEKAAIASCTVGRSDAAKRLADAVEDLIMKEEPKA